MRRTAAAHIVAVPIPAAGSGAKSYRGGCGAAAAIEYIFAVVTLLARGSAGRCLASVLPLNAVFKLTIVAGRLLSVDSRIIVAAFNLIAIIAAAASHRVSAAIVVGAAKAIRPAVSGLEIVVAPIVARRSRAEVVAAPVVGAIVAWCIEKSAIAHIVAVAEVAIAVAHTAVGAEGHSAIGIHTGAMAPAHTAINTVDGRAVEVIESAVVVVVGHHYAHSRPPHQRAIEVGDVGIARKLPVKQHISKVLVAIAPIRAIDVAGIGHVQKVV